ncbi:MAG: DUF917 domain-containing protein [Defluviitaleaceae bacterium]|nr:DUF917 domain-containing protein [Defluviitaleaceae bacterium]
MSRTLTKPRIKNILEGACFMASGGGGSLPIAFKMLESCPNTSVELYSANELLPNDKVIVVAGLGAPTAVNANTFADILENTFDCYKANAKIYNPDQNIAGVISVEYGGLNTLAPIYLAMKNSNVKLVDADGTGRAVPGLDTIFLSLNGISLSPLALASSNGSNAFIKTHDITDTPFYESLVRATVSNPFFGPIIGIGAWEMDKNTVMEKSLVGALTKAELIGKVIERFRNGELKYDGIFQAIEKELSGKLGFPANEGFVKELGHNSRLTYVGNLKSYSGFDATRYDICCGNTSQPTHSILNFNESLVIIDLATNTAISTAPDIICIFDDNEKVPLTNDVIEKNKEKYLNTPVSIGIIRVSEKWNQFNADEINKIWSPYFDKLDYKDGCVFYPF